MSTERDGRRVRAIVNWGLALLTVPGALVVLAFAAGAIMSTDRCAWVHCARQGPPDPILGALWYGAPLVALVTVVASFWTAKRGWGTLIPLAALAFFITEVAVLYLTFRP